MECCWQHSTRVWRLSKAQSEWTEVRSSWAVRGTKEAGKGAPRTFVLGWCFDLCQWIKYSHMACMMQGMDINNPFTRKSCPVQNIKANWEYAGTTPASRSGHFNLRVKVLVQRPDSFGVGLDNWKEKKIFSLLSRIELRSVGLAHRSVLYRRVRLEAGIPPPPARGLF
jgi:hypothetical protein